MIGVFVLMLRLCRLRVMVLVMGARVQTGQLMPGTVGMGMMPAAPQQAVRQQGDRSRGGGNAVKHDDQRRSRYVRCCSTQVIVPVFVVAVNGNSCVRTDANPYYADLAALGRIG